MVTRSKGKKAKPEEPDITDEDSDQTEEISSPKETIPANAPPKPKDILKIENILKELPSNLSKPSISNQTKDTSAIRYNMKSPVEKPELMDDAHTHTGFTPRPSEVKLLCSTHPASFELIYNCARAPTEKCQTASNGEVVIRSRVIWSKTAPDL